MGCREEELRPGQESAAKPFPLLIQSPSLTQMGVPLPLLQEPTPQPRISPWAQLAHNHRWWEGDGGDITARVRGALHPALTLVSPLLFRRRSRRSLARGMHSWGGCHRQRGTRGRVTRGRAGAHSDPSAGGRGRALPEGCRPEASRQTRFPAGQGPPVLEQQGREPRGSALNREGPSWGPRRPGSCQCFYNRVPRGTHVLPWLMATRQRPEARLSLPTVHTSDTSGCSQSPCCPLPTFLGTGLPSQLPAPKGAQPR